MLDKVPSADAGVRAAQLEPLDGGCHLNREVEGCCLGGFARGGTGGCAYAFGTRGLPPKAHPEAAFASTSW